MVKTKIVTLALFAFTARPSNARADAGDWWCPIGWNWSAFSSIPVWIHFDLGSSSLMQHPNGTYWSSGELQREVEFILERVMDQAPSGMPPLYFAGFEDPSVGWDDPAGNGVGLGHISIRPDLEVGDECSPEMRGNPIASKGIRIRIAPSTVCSTKYVHWTLNHATNQVFGGILMHELNHALGFHHWGQCNSNPPACVDNPSEPQICGLMQNSGLSAESYESEYADWDGLVSHYGTWEVDGEHRRYSSDALNWLTRVDIAFSSGPMMGAAWTSPGSQLMSLATTDPTTLYPHLWRWNGSTGAFDDMGVPYAGQQLGPIAADRNGSYRFLFFMQDPDMTSAVKRPRFSYHDPTTGSSTVLYSSQYAGRHGHTGDYDPKSGKLVQVWRDADNYVLMSLSDPTSNPATATTPIALNDLSNKAAYTPSVSCGDSDVVYNCIMVWASSAAGAGQHYHLLRWVQFYVSGSSFVFANVYESGKIMFGPPAVAYNGPLGSDDSFVVAYKNPGQCWYTQRKSQFSTSTFSDERSHCAGANRHVGPPLIGSVSDVHQTWAVYNERD